MAPDSSTAHITQNSLLTPTLNAWRIFLQDQANSPHTVKAFIHDLQLLASFLPPDRTLVNIGTTDLNNFLSWLQNGRGVACSPKTLARRITSIKAFFRWLTKNGVLMIDPAEKVLQKSVLSPLPTVLTPEEVELIMETADKHRTDKKPDARYYILFSLLINTGIKKSECLNLNLNHIDLDATGGPLLFIRYGNPQNRYKERKIQLPQSWLVSLQEYKTQYMITDRLFPWSQRRLEYLLEDLSQEVGLDKHISFDMCRWTCALLDWNAGLEREKIRQKLGISKVQWREVNMKLKRLANPGLHPVLEED
jgi:site-specific recombinase XerD